MGVLDLVAGSSSPDFRTVRRAGARGTRSPKAYAALARRLGTAPVVTRLMRSPPLASRRYLVPHLLFASATLASEPSFAT